ncbi:unnamed protein product, partial [Bubo scandiacus]
MAAPATPQPRLRHGAPPLLLLLTALATALACHHLPPRHDTFPWDSLQLLQAMAPSPTQPCHPRQAPVFPDTLLHTSHPQQAAATRPPHPPAPPPHPQQPQHPPTLGRPGTTPTPQQPPAPHPAAPPMPDRQRHARPRPRAPQPHAHPRQILQGHPALPPHPPPQRLRLGPRPPPSSRLLPTPPPPHPHHAQL